MRIKRRKVLKDVTPETVFWRGQRAPGGSGGSGRGWTYYSTLQACPWRFYLRFSQGIEQERAHARDVGTLLHWMKWIYFAGGDAREWQDALIDATTFGFGENDPSDAVAAQQESEAIQQRAMTKDAFAEAVDRLHEVREKIPGLHADTQTAEDAFTSWYDCHAANDRRYYKVLAQEHHLSLPLEHSGFKYTTQLDLALTETKTNAIHVLEFKHWTTMRTEHYERAEIDGQLMGHLYLARAAWPAREIKLFLDVTVTNKDMECERYEVSFEQEQLDRYIDELRAVWAMRGIYEQMGYPMFHASCGTRYPHAPGGLCDFHRICKEHPIDLENLPMGLVKGRSKLVG